MCAGITRRTLIVKLATLCLTLLLMVVPLTQGQSVASDPQYVVPGFDGVLLISNMRDGRILSESGRLARLAPVVDRTFDIPAMTRLAVGPSWAKLTPAQQRQLIAAFGHEIHWIGTDLGTPSSSSRACFRVRFARTGRATRRIVQ
jgi:ABC-type transporter MlaC component